MNGAQHDVTKTGDWSKALEISLQSMPCLIAFKAHNSNDYAGVLASLSDKDGEDVAVTDPKWRCSAVHEDGWEMVEFREISNVWSNAVIIHNHGEGPWDWIRGKYVKNVQNYKWRHFPYIFSLSSFSTVIKIRYYFQGSLWESPSKLSGSGLVR